MNFEVLKKYHLKRNIIIGVVAVLIISAIILNFTRAKYRTTQSIPLVNGTINYSASDLNVVAITVDGESSDTIPEGNYELTEESYCTINGIENKNITLKYNANTKSLSISPFTSKGTKCYLNFTKRYTASEIILENNRGIEVIEAKETPNFSQIATADEGMYTAEDNLGTSYYFRGNVENNYILFAGFYWRIIRINGDGSIRIIYDGTTPHENGESSTDRHIGTSIYNSANNYSYYVGYTYTSTQRPSIQNDGTSSTIKEILDNWYSEHLQQYDSFIVNTPGFCNDRNTANNVTWTANQNFQYVTYERLVTNKTPTLKCENILDLYTTKIGLITADEAAMAGGVVGTNNTNYYLYTGQYYWTMSPYDSHGSSRSNLFRIDSSGNLDSYSSTNITLSVRPVINLSPNSTLSGIGTIFNPYVLSDI